MNTDEKARATYRKVWDAIVDTLSLDPEYDRDGAVKLADHAVDALAYRESYMREHDAVQRERRRHRRRVRWAAFWVAVTALATCVSVWGGFTIDHAIHSDDWAGIDSHKVQLRGSEALQQWLGKDEASPSYLLLDKRKAGQNGQHAWWTRWRAADGKVVCAYVWSRDLAVDEARTVSCP